MKPTTLAIAALVLLAMPTGLALPSPLTGVGPNNGVTDAANALIPSNVDAAVSGVTSKALYEKNLGQWNPDVLFKINARSYTGFITSTGFVLVQPSTDPDAAEVWAIRMELTGGNPAALAATGTPVSSYTNYFVGNDPAAWRTQVPSFTDVTMHDVYPGIDLVYHGDSDMKYDFIVHPGSDPAIIQQRFQNADVTTNDGSLVLTTPLGAVNLGQPVTYEADGDAVANEYQVNGETVTFQLGAYDAAQDLVIDPAIYSTYLGGSGYEQGQGIAVDSAGNAYVTGYTESTNFDTLNPYQGSIQGSTDAFVSKFTPTGSLAYSTYLGGGSNDWAYDIAVDASGNAIVAGATTSTDFDTLNAYQTTGAGQEAFVTKLTTTGALIYSTYLGGTYSDEASGIAVDSAGNAYVTGWTESPNFDLLLPNQSTMSIREAFVTKFTPAGGLAYSTYLGGSNTDQGTDIAVDSAGSAYVVGITKSFNFPTLNPYQQWISSGYDAFVTKFTPAGSLSYSTYLGADGSSDLGLGIAVDSAGSAFVTGSTNSMNFPTLSPYQIALDGPTDGFVTKFTVTGGLAYSTYLGGSSDDEASAITVDSADNAYVTGISYSDNFDVVNAYYPTSAGGDGFASKFTALGGLSFSTFLSSSTGDYGNGVVVDASNTAIISGFTGSYNFPVVNAYQSTLAGSLDAFVSKLAPVGTPTNLAASCGSPHGIRLTWTAPVGPPAAQYNVYRSSDAVTYSFVASTVQTNYVDVPAWTTSSYYYKVSASNADGEGATTAPVSRAPCDSQAPTFSGSNSNLGWRTTIPTLSGAAWQDTYSGLVGATYSVGTSSGLSDVLGTTNIPTQPTSGQTTSYTPSWTPSAAVQGQNYVNVRVTDRAGMATTSNGVYQFGLDNLAPTAPGAPYTTPWLNTAPTLGNVCFQDVGSGLASGSARYWVGSTSGGSQYQTATAMSTQPTNGQTTTWCPTLTFNAGVLHQGLNYVTIEVKDTLGQTLTCNAYIVRYDTQGDPVTGLVAKTGAGGALIPMDVWQNDNTPRFEWAVSSTSPIAGYSLTWDTTGAQTPDTTTETSSPYYDSSPRSDGPWYFRVRAVDSASNAGTPTSAFIVKIDTTLPSLPVVSSGTHADVTKYYNSALARFAWSATDSLSGIDGYSYDIVPGGATGSPDTIKDAEEATTSMTYSNVGAFGTWTFRVRAVDNAGNWGPTAYKTIHIDTIAPVFTLWTPTGDGAQPTDIIRVFYNDRDNEMDTLQTTGVDVSKVDFWVDGQNIIAMYSQLCPPAGTLCYLRVTATGIEYKPIQPWADGPHTASVHIQDTAAGTANGNNLNWTFTVNSGSAADQDGDRIPDETEGEICGRSATALIVSGSSFLGHSCNGISDYVPPAVGGTYLVPRGVVAGPDADGDGFPAYVAVQKYAITVNPFSLAVVQVVVGDDQVVWVDTQDDNPNYPAQSQATVGPVLIGATPGADNDQDGVPGTIVFSGASLVIDRSSPTPVSVVPSSMPPQQVDPNDSDPNVPGSSVVTLPYAVPTGLSFGPDNDHDGVPQTATVRMSYLTIDRRNSDPLSYQDGAPVTQSLDTADNDPNWPVPLTRQSVSIPLSVSYVDGDGDGIPGAVMVSWFDVTVDRTQQSPVTTGSHQSTPVNPDTNDGNANAPVPYNAYDGDGDKVPDASEFAVCFVEDRRTPTDGTCNGNDYTPPRLT